MNVHKLVLLGVLTASAIVIGILESFIPSIGIPGVKLGLTNIVILVTIFELGVFEASIISMLRVVIVAVTHGTLFSMGFLMSLSGAILSLGIMVILFYTIKKFSIIGISVIGALFHVIGQILVAMLYLGTTYILFYLPIIAISAIITGVIVGLISQAIIRTGVIKKQRQKYDF